MRARLTKLTQVIDLMSRLANPTGKPVVLFAENYGGNAVKDIERMGGIVVKDIKDLIGLVR